MVSLDCLSLCFIQCVVKHSLSVLQCYALLINYLYRCYFYDHCTVYEKIFVDNLYNFVRCEISLDSGI